MHKHINQEKEKQLESAKGLIAQKKPSETSQFEIKDNRPEAIAQMRIKTMAEVTEVPIQRQENNTGLPDHLKSGVESLSGHSMDDVKVHYNSDKPAQLNAHAYAQGTDIHLGPGQEKHLPHEAWHVVQQKQGRVKPTMQMKGQVNINDDAGLEKEADAMGVKAISDDIKKQKNLIQATKAGSTRTHQLAGYGYAEGGMQNGELLITWTDEGGVDEKLRIRYNTFKGKYLPIDGAENFSRQSFILVDEDDKIYSIGYDGILYKESSKKLSDYTGICTKLPKKFEKQPGSGGRSFATKPVSPVETYKAANGGSMKGYLPDERKDDFSLKRQKTIAKDRKLDKVKNYDIPTITEELLKLDTSKEEERKKFMKDKSFNHKLADSRIRVILSNLNEKCEPKKITKKQEKLIGAFFKSLSGDSALAIGYAKSFRSKKAGSKLSNSQLQKIRTNLSNGGRNLKIGYAEENQWVSSGFDPSMNLDGSHTPWTGEIHKSLEALKAAGLVSSNIVEEALNPVKVLVKSKKKHKDSGGKSLGKRKPEAIDSRRHLDDVDKEVKMKRFKLN